MTLGEQRPRPRGITRSRCFPKQQIITRTSPSFGLRSGRLWSRRLPMWLQLTAGIISDRSSPQIAVCAALYAWSSCLRALTRMKLARGGRKRSSGESSVCTLPLSLEDGVTSSIWLNSECRAKQSLSDTTWSIRTILAGAPPKSEIPAFAQATAGKLHPKFEMSSACRKTTFLPLRVSSKRRIFRA